MAKLLTGNKKPRTSPQLTAALAAMGRTQTSAGGEGGEEEEEVVQTTTEATATDTDGGEGGEADTTTTTTTTTTSDAPAATLEQATADLTAARTRVSELETAASTALIAHNAALTTVQNQLNAANTELVTLRANAETNRASHEAVVAGATQMRAVCLASIARLDTILGVESVGLDKLSHTELVAHYNKLNEKFEQKYPQGGKSNTGADVTAKPVIEAAPQDEQERLLRQAAATTRGKK